MIGHGKSPQACLEKFVLPPIAIPYGLCRPFVRPRIVIKPGSSLLSSPPRLLFHSSTFGPHLSFVLSFSLPIASTTTLPTRTSCPSDSSYHPTVLLIHELATSSSTQPVRPRTVNYTQRPLLPFPLRAKSIPMSEARFPNTVKRLDLLRHPCRHTSTGSPSVAEHLSS